MLMNSLESALDHLEFTQTGDAKDASLARLAVEEALSEFLSAATVGDAEELRSIARRIFQKVPARRLDPSADAWVTALEVLGRGAQRFYELTAPQQEAVNALENPTARQIFNEIAQRGRIRARDLRRRLGIEDQSNLARTIRKLVRGELVAVEHDSENAAWYRPTLAGKRRPI